jgi:hypothetical protein
MADDGKYEKRLQEIKHVFGERKAINKRFLSTCESKVKSVSSSENPTKWIIGKLAFQEFEDVWDNFERLATVMLNSIQNLDQRIHTLESIAVETGSINPEDIASVAKFAEEFRQHVEETKKKLVEYKQKMEENDLAT